MQIDPSLGTISTSVQVPELALTDVRLGIVQRLSEVDNIGLSLDVDTLSSFVSSFSSVLWTLYHHGFELFMATAVFVLSSSMATCMLITSN